MFVRHPLFVQFGDLSPEAAKATVTGVILLLGAGIAWRMRRRWGRPLADPEFAPQWAIACLFAALMSLGLVAAVLTWNPTLPVWLRRLNEASFWIYLAHHPVVGLAHIALAPTTLTPAVRFLLATAAAISLCLLTWHIAVRGTWVDIVLHGRPRSRPVPSAQPLSDAPARAA